jgi:two-component sensor histidine kinase
MLRFPASAWRKWPVLAALLAFCFITYGVNLMSRSRGEQASIGREVRLLDALSRLGGELHRLEVVHRVDVNSGQRQWPRELEALRRQSRTICDEFRGLPGVDDLLSDLEPPLAQADSLHHQAMPGVMPLADPRSNEAVFQLMMGRAQKAVERNARAVHEKGLSAHSATLSRQWNEAQALLVAACLLALAMAWLVGARGRLLAESRERALQLEVTGRELTETNRVLRETMLSKEEKEVMIKEIHHRVKNNLQIVKSLIRFQMDQVKDPKTLELFNECVNRVSAMALVHEQTYLSKDLANIPVDGYLDSLVRDLVHAYSVNVKLNMDVDIRVRTLSVDALVPLGLLINEVISNSFKYAFEGRGTGTITVHINGSEQEGLHLIIGDDGVGLKSRDGFHRPNSLGMDLIHTLAGQLDGLMTLVDGPGTMYEMRPRPQQRRKRA